MSDHDKVMIIIRMKRQALIALGASGGINADFATTVAEIGEFQRLLECHPVYFMQVRVPADFPTRET
jgi:hypothetical protein